MSNYKRPVLFWFVSMAFLVPASGFAGPQKPSVKARNVSRELLRHSDVPGTDMELRVYLISYPPGVSAPLHHHPAAGVGYIVEGKAESKYQEHTAQIISKGESFEDLAVTPHEVFKNVSADQPLVFIISYVVKKGASVVETP